MRPRPTTPTVLSVTSTPVKRDRFHSPARRLDAACGTRRATASSKATACSAAETMLEVGALTTSTPLAVAAATSTLSSPTPARATTLSRSATASASLSTCVALRTMRASAPRRAGSNADRSAPSTVRTSNSPESTSRALGASSSATSTTGRDMAPTLPASSDPPIADDDAQHQPATAQGGDHEQHERDRGIAGDAVVGLHVRQQRRTHDQRREHQPGGDPVGHAMQAAQELLLVDRVDLQLEPAAGQGVHRGVDPAGQPLGEV